MTDTAVLHLASQALVVAAKLAGPGLLAAAAAGLLISLLQAVFGVNDQSLSFVPKVAAVAAVLVFSGSWMLKVLISFTTELFTSIPTLVR